LTRPFTQRVVGGRLEAITRWSPRRRLVVGLEVLGGHLEDLLSGHLEGTLDRLLDRRLDPRLTPRRHMCVHVDLTRRRLRPRWSRSRMRLHVHLREQFGGVVQGASPTEATESIAQSVTPIASDPPSSYCTLSFSPLRCRSGSFSMLEACVSAAKSTDLSLSGLMESQPYLPPSPSLYTESSRGGWIPYHKPPRLYI
jgi:hypothetical protein